MKDHGRAIAAPPWQVEPMSRVLVIGLPELPASLRAAGLKVLATATPDEAEGVAFSLAILDGTLPGARAFAVDLRARGRSEPLLIVGGDRPLSRLADVVFPPGTDVATLVDAARAGRPPPRWLRIGDRTVDLAARRAGPEGLTEAEASLLAALASAGEAGLTREELLRRVFGSRVAIRAVDQLVARLRPKIEDADRPAVRTLRGQGYALDCEILAGPPASWGLHVPPRPPAPLIGADRILDDLRRAWDAGHPVVALHGPAGCGKSSVARAFAASVPGVVAVDLTAGIPAIPAGIVLLDDADPVAVPLARALADRPDVRAIWTSRERPALASAACFAVPPWDLDDARRLAAARGVAGADALLAAVLASTGGNPLAVELALARLALLTPAELTARLAEPGVLGDPVRRPPRHRRWEDAVAWGG
jgi:hypothetical protein